MQAQLTALESENENLSSEAKRTLNMLDTLSSKPPTETATTPPVETN